MCDILWLSGAPADVLQLLAGPGQWSAPPWCGDADTALIAFTGSKEVGLEIIATAGRTVGGSGR